MNKLFTIYLLLISFGLFGQEFSTTPFSVVKSWVEKNTSIQNLKSDKPEGYYVASEDNKMLVLEKKMDNNDIHDIKFFFTDNILTGIMFSQHYSKIFRLMSEIEELGFTLSEEHEINRVESLFYDNNKNQGAIIIINKNDRKVTCSFSNK